MRRRSPRLSDIHRRLNDGERPWIVEVFGLTHLPDPHPWRHSPRVVHLQRHRHGACAKAGIALPLRPREDNASAPQETGSPKALPREGAGESRARARDLTSLILGSQAGQDSAAAEFYLHLRRNPPYTPLPSAWDPRPAISSVSVRRSSTRNGLRPAATARNTSGSPASVHSVGSDLRTPSSSKKNTRS